MIPLHLSLQNFLSYREAQLDFRDLRAACVCGSNGAGKSSLLEAIAWALWGKGRATTDDDTIRTGAEEVQVHFTFTCDRQTYRVSRSRRRNKSSRLEFQIETATGHFRSLTAKGVRATQQKINESLRLDYDTFVNSAYLRQGRADEFMLQLPQKRKEILAALLKLDHYQELADQAKDAAKQFKGRQEQIDQERQHLEAQLQEQAAVQAQLQQVGKTLQQLQNQQQQEREQLTHLQAKVYERQSWQQMLQVQQQQAENLAGDCQRLEGDRQALNQQIDACQQLLARREEITAGYQAFQQQQAWLEELAVKLRQDRALEQQLHQHQEHLRAEAQTLERQLQQRQHQLTTIAQQQQELAAILNREAAIQQAMAQLEEQRQRLAALDKLKLQVAPLEQRRQQLQVALGQAQAQLEAKREQLQLQAQDLRRQQAQRPQWQAELATLQAQITALRHKRVYLDRVHEKGNQRRIHSERLCLDQDNDTEKLAALQQKLDLLQQPGAACPLCDRPLDDHHREHVRQKTLAEQADANNRILDLRGQLAVCQRELEDLRREYKAIKEDLAPFDRLCQQQGQLEMQLEGCADLETRQQQCDAEQQALEQALATQTYAPEVQAELAALEAQLAALSYDEQTHSLVRGEVDRRRKAEFDYLELQRAQRSQAQLTAQAPQVEAALAALEQQRQQLLAQSPLAQAIQTLTAQRAALGYDPQHHEQVQQAARQAQAWQLPYQQLQQAEAELPTWQARQGELEAALAQRQAERDRALATVQELEAKLTALPDYQPQVAQLEQQLGDRQQAIHEQLAQQGALQQQLLQFETITQRCQYLQGLTQAARRRQRVYQELSQAFGKNGIQALMLENILPQLEAQTNQILARLTGNQLHVQFLTQRAAKSKQPKMIDTLDILIADARGTRPYETYSGGEAFRINFAIRLALARLLAQRSGASLQMLIIDEGFGTQDVEGCDRLIAAINAIADEFACILTVTHMPQFKEAFQTRIEVSKTDQGSVLRVVS